MSRTDALKAAIFAELEARRGQIDGVDELVARVEAQQLAVPQGIKPTYTEVDWRDADGFYHSVEGLGF